MSETLHLRRMIVRFLARSSETDPLEMFGPVAEEVWRQNLRWLDRSGLALPLAAAVQAHRPCAGVPAPIRAALQSRLLDNQKRMERMLECLQEATQALTVAGARYCCVKGFSLIPDCFDGIRERHQVDLDFLVAPEDLKCAQSAIESLGYRVQRASVSGEVRLIKPWKKHIGVNGYLYQMPEDPPIELHTRIWEPESDEIEFGPLFVFTDATEVHEVRGVEFSRLRPAQHFVYLLLHIFRHLLGSWTRLISLYEIAAFIRARSANQELWAETGQLIGNDTRLASVCALILGLVDFACPQQLPEALCAIYPGKLSVDSAVWINRWAPNWLFADPPGNKLSLLVLKQFWPDNHAWRRYLRRRLLPIQKPPQLSDQTARSTRRYFAFRAEELWYQASRAWYHVKSDCSFLVALTRWERERRTNRGSVCQVVGGCE